MAVGSSLSANTVLADQLFAQERPVDILQEANRAEAQSRGCLASGLDRLERPPEVFPNSEVEKTERPGESESAQVIGGGSVDAVGRGIAPASKYGSAAATNKIDSDNTTIATRWQEYQGRSQWQGLLEPLDDALKREIIKYGNFAQVCYDAFDFDDDSTNCGNCLYAQESLLRETGLDNTGYEVTKYLYAMSDVHVPKWLKSSLLRSEAWSKDSNWMGFVAVARDKEEIRRLGRRDIVVAWRGTVTSLEWLQDLDGVLAAITAEGGRGECGECSTVDEDLYRFASTIPRDEENEEWSTASAVDDPDSEGADIIGVERGFWTLYTSRNEKTRYNKTSAAQQMREELRRLVEEHSGEELSITVTGHSLGGALALLSAFDIAASGINRSTPVSAITFAAPRAGNSAFKRKLQELKVNVLRMVNVNDIVPKVPATIMERITATLTRTYAGGVQEEGLWEWAYCHEGVELLLDNGNSPYLKKTWNLADFHNLEVYLHLVDGYRSVREPFVDEIRRRDLALVNKSSGLLVEKLHVPAGWLHEQQQDSSQGRSTARSSQSPLSAPHFTT